MKGNTGIRETTNGFNNNRSELSFQWIQIITFYIIFAKLPWYSNL